MSLRVIYFHTNEELPESVRASLPDAVVLSLFRAALNSHLSEGRTEMHAYIKAYKVLEDAGYARNAEGTWVPKETITKDAPTVSDVHVNRPLGSDDEEEETEKDDPGTDAAFVSEEQMDEPIVEKRVYMPPIEVHRACKAALDAGYSVEGITDELAAERGIPVDAVRRIAIHLAADAAREESEVEKNAWGGKHAAKWVVRVMKKVHEEPWHAVDLDKTLAIKDGESYDELKIGEPIPAMVAQVKAWLAAGEKVKIFTARVADDKDGKVARAIQDWTEEHIGVRLPVTNEKTPGIIDITDDKAQGVVENTGITKFDPDQPRDEAGKWTAEGGGGEPTHASATAPRVFNTRDDIVERSSWGDKYWGWKDHPVQVLTGHPLEKESLPETLYHVTTAADAVASSGVLLGQMNDAGLGGGQAPGVSFTADKDDARVIQRELDRAVAIAQNEDNIEAFTRYAREDEKAAGLSEGTLDKVVEKAKYAYSVNAESSYYKQHPESAKSLVHDAFNQYLNSRDFGFAKEHPILKNPLLFSNRDTLAHMDRKQIKILAVPSRNIPDKALITSGSDDFLHEVRAYSDVPVHGLKVTKADEEADGHWITTDNGHHIFIGGSESTKSDLARAHYKPSTAAKQQEADRTEQTLARALGAERTANNAPFDLLIGKAAVEIKTLVDNRNSKVTMHPESRRRKLEFAKQNKLRMYTVVADKREGKRATYYFSAGVGSFRLGAMQRVTLEDLKRKVR